MESPEPRAPESPFLIPSPLQSVGIVAGAMLVLIVGHVVFQVLGAALFFTPEQRTTMGDPARSLFLHHPAWIVLGTAVPELFLGATLAWVVVRLRVPVATVFPLHVPGAASFIGALLVVFGLTPLADLVYVAVLRSGFLQSPDAAPVPELLERALTGAGPLHLAGVVLGLAVVPAIVEEALFRGLVTASHRHSFWAALLAPAALFGMIHLEPAQAAGTLVLGIGFGAARLFSGSLLTPMFAHAVYNGFVIVAAHASPPSADETPTVAAIVAGLAAAVAGVVLLPLGRVDGPAPRPEVARDVEP